MSLNDCIKKYSEAESDLLEQFKAEVFNWLKNESSIESIGWAQYTPYFNDGDPCTFGVRLYDCADIFIDGERPYDRDDKYLEELQYLFDIISRMPPSVLQTLGEGVITFTSDGACYCEDYDHD